MTWWESLEQTRQQLQAQFDSQQSKAERNQRGQFATPFHLARQIISLARTYQPLPAQDLRFLEPAIGLGAFYSALLESTKGKPPHVAVGFEIEQHLVELAQQLWGSTGLTVHAADFTAMKPPTTEAKKFNFLVTNPPYVRHHHLSNQQKRRLGNLVVGRSHRKPSGLMGLYGYFLLLADAWLQQDGVGVWLIPTEFMDVGYGTVLKEYLTSEVELLRVHRFEAEDIQFIDADVTSSVVILRKRVPASGHTVTFSVGPDLEHPRSIVSVPVEELKRIRKWSLIGQRLHQPVHRSSGHLDSTVTLGELFDIKRGLATGANEFFIMTADEAALRGIPEIFLKPILPSPRYLRYQQVIEADLRGNPKVEPMLFLLDCPLTKDQLADQYPELYSYILEGEKMGLHRRYLLSRRDPWYRQEERFPTPLVCGYMARKGEDGKSIRFYRNKSQAIATNVYLMLYPKPELLKFSPDPEALFDRLFEELFNLDQDEVVCHGRTYGGGLNKIEPQELQQVSVPLTDELEALIRLPRQQQLLEERTEYTAVLEVPS